MAPKNRQSAPLLWSVIFLLLLCWIFCIIYFIQSTKLSLFSVISWTISQWISWPLSSSLGRVLQENAWTAWSNTEHTDTIILNCPILDFLEKNIATERLVETVEAKYGTKWRDRPILLRGLWSRKELENENRRLSLSGLLRENLSIPYFSNASVSYALSPDATAPISAIVKNMTLGHPHKIGTQLLVEAYPELITEVAPTDIVTALFGDYFTPSHVVGSGPLNLFRGTTTVPVFVARTGESATKTSKDDNTCTDHHNHDTHPRTDLHCEPIGNVAVQLRGEKQWVLVSPEYSFRIQPAVAPDGRAFFASFSGNIKYVPQYQVTTRAGDALWIPTWTWHRVDYIGEKQDVAIGGSLFHFRPADFFRNNPLFAMLIIPSLIKELVGYNTQ